MTSSDCYGAADTRIERIANGATAPSTTPALPFAGTFGIANVATAGALVYAMISHSVYPNTLTNLVVLSGGTWSLVGATTSVIPDASLATDGRRVYAGLHPAFGGGAQSIAAGASATDAWTQLPFATAAEGAFTGLDTKGTLFSMLGSSLYRRLAGDSAWRLVENAGAVANPNSAGRRLTVAANGDVWFTGLRFGTDAHVAKVLAGTSSWVSINLPPGHDSASQIVVVRILVLSVPAFTSSASIRSRMFLVCSVTDLPEASEATWPAR